MFGDACYRAFELSERVWYPQSVAAVRLRGGETAEILIVTGFGGRSISIVELEDETVSDVQEFVRSNEQYWYWPPHAIDLDRDGTEEAVFAQWHPGNDVLVLDYDDARADAYTLEVREALLPYPTYYLLGAVEADGDADAELIAIIGGEAPPDYERNLAVIDRQGDAWVDVGARFPFRHLEEPPPIKVFSSGAGKSLLGMLVQPLDGDPYDYVYDMVHVIRVTPDLRLELDGVLDPGAALRDLWDYASADVDGDGDLDVVLAGAKPEPACAVYLRDDEGWSGPDVFPGCGVAAAVGDVTNDAVAEILFPAGTAMDYRTKVQFAFVADARWPFALVDANADMPREILYLPSTARQSVPSSLHLLISIPNR